MSRRNPMTGSEQGFTLVEMIIVVVLVGILATATYSIFNASISQYFTLQKDGSNFTDIAAQTQRIGNVLRGATDIISANTNDLSLYAYFAPSDTYVSQIHYYLDPTKTELMADVTPLNANPPIGTPITAQERTYTIIPNYYQATGVNLFVYLDASGNALTLPITDETTIKGIQVNLAAPGSFNSNAQNVSLQVSLRNRKTNL